MRNRLLIAAVPVLALVIAFVATRGTTPTVADTGHDHSAMVASDSLRPVSLSPEDARRIGVTFARVESGSVSRRIRTAGQVTFDETRVTTISPRIDGWVERLHVDFTGRAVLRGEPLFAIYAPMLVTAQEELLLAHRLARDVSGGAADARSGADDLIASARRRLAYWDVPAQEIARIERTGQVQRTITLRAPSTGIVVEKNVTQGQRVMAGDAVYRVADISTVWVDGEIYEQDLAAVREGQPAVAEFDAYPGERWAGRIAYVYPTMSTETRTARVRVAIPNPNHRLKPGMFATLHITGTPRTASLSVPRSAVLVTGERHLVFVRAAGGRLEPRLVQVGATTGDRAEILRGLAAGETVVASATFLIDAESNLGTALDAMSDMPGMEVRVPSVGPSGGTAASAPAVRQSGEPAGAAADPHAAHRH